MQNALGYIFIKRNAVGLLTSLAGGLASLLLVLLLLGDLIRILDS